MPAFGAPFVWLSRDHAFLAVDLLSLLGCYAGFLAFARRLGIPAAWGSLVDIVAPGFLDRQTILRSGRVTGTANPRCCTTR